MSGIGNVLLHAERTLRASISGAGNIEDIGDPAVTEHVSGLGRVKRRESNPGGRVAAANQWSRSAPAFLKNSGPPVIGSPSGWMPGRNRTSVTRQSRMSESSMAPTCRTASYA